jgi:hypothetical protein
MKIFKSIGLLIGSSILLSALSSHSIAVASNLENQDIILSSNGAAGAEDWEYNASAGQGWVRYTSNWQPTGRIKQVRWRCVDNCKDARKFEYRIKLVDGKIIILMRATNKEQGLIRVELNALVD